MNDTIIFLVLAGLALVFKWLTSQRSGDEEKPEPPSPNDRASRRPPPESEEERVRRFLEALGAPPGTAPPPPVRPRRVVAPAPRKARPAVRRSWVQPLPPLVTTPEAPPPLPPLTTASPPKPVVVVQREPASELVIAPPLPNTVSSRLSAASARPAPRMSLGAILRSRDSIRRAIILREVLGPPRGLESFGHFQNP